MTHDDAVKLPHSGDAWIGRTLSDRFLSVRGSRMYYDNPETLLRECWIYGGWVGSVHRAVIDAHGSVEWCCWGSGTLQSKRARVEPFQPGRLLGPRKVEHVAWAFTEPGREKWRCCDYREVTNDA